MFAWRSRLPRRRRVRWSGWTLLITIGLLLAAALNTGTNLLYVVFGACLSLMLLSMLLRPLNMIGVRISRSAPRAVFRGQKSIIEVTIENRKYLLPAIGVRVEDARAPGRVLGFAARIPARRKAVVHVHETFQRRGVQMLSVYDAVSGFPFGFSDASVRLAEETEVIVYPRVRPVRAAGLEHTRGDRFTPRAPSSDGDEFFSLREYVVGDDMRRIAWRASARLGTWMIRELSKDNARHVIFALDTRTVAEMADFETQFEDMIELAASFAVMLLSKQFCVGIQTPDGVLEGGEGTAYERKVLDFLARVQEVPAGEHPNFDAIVEVISSRAATVVYLSPDPALWGRRGGPGNARVLDPREVIYA